MNQTKWQQSCYPDRFLSQPQSLFPRLNEGIRSQRDDWPSNESNYKWNSGDLANKASWLVVGHLTQEERIWRSAMTGGHQIHLSKRALNNKLMFDQYLASLRRGYTWSVIHNVTLLMRASQVNWTSSDETDRDCFKHGGLKVLELLAWPKALTDTGHPTGAKPFGWPT